MQDSNFVKPPRTDLGPNMFGGVQLSHPRTHVHTQCRYMPKFLLPRCSGAHRIAAIALYRVLLTQCRVFPGLELHQRHELQNIVRNRFKQARHTTSERWLRLDFEAGYEAVDHLDAAIAGSDASRDYILQLLARAPAKVKQDPPVVRTKRQQRLLKRNCRQDEPAESEWQDHPPRRSILERPLPLDRLSGRRHVPVLFNAQGIPVLRIKKPQPHALSAYIKDRLKKKQKQTDTRYRLDAELELARTEDAWDSLLAALTQAEDGKREDNRSGEPSWTEAVELSQKENLDKHLAEKQKNREMAEKMQAIVDQERALYEKEKEDLAAIRRERKAQFAQRRSEEPKMGPSSASLDDNGTTQSP